MSAPTAARTRIKICGLTREADVDAAVEAGADAVGFVLYPAKSPRAVTAQRAATLASRLPPFVTPVLLFVNEAPTQARARWRPCPARWRSSMATRPLRNAGQPAGPERTVTCA
jgi:hypothetical protein